jgi:hypothetical protein
VSTSYVVYNPSGDTVDADASSCSPTPRPSAPDIPITTSIRPGATATVAVSEDTPGTTNSGYWVSVQSRDDKPIVVERVVRSDAPAPRVAPSFTIGSPVVANQWIVAAAGGTGQASGQVVVTNLSPTSSVVLSVAVAGGGSAAPVPGFDQVELLAGRRTLVDLSTLPGADGASSRLLVTVTTSGPVVVEQASTFTDPASVSDLIAVPVRDTLARPPADLAAEAAAAPLPTIPGTGTVPFQTVPPLPTIPPATDDPGTSVPPDSQPEVPGGDATTTTTALDPAVPTTAVPAAPGT